MASLLDRMVRAAKLDVNLYEEVEADKSAMGQALTVVVLSSVASGIGTIGILGIQGLIIGTISALIGWFVWAYLTYFIGTKLLPEPQTKADVAIMSKDLEINGPDSPHFKSQEVESDPIAWEEVAEGRFLPRRVRGSCKGRALG